jgi:uncharacterized DUF497 family protein
MRQDPLDGCIGFDWDEHNSAKNWDLHGVTPEEAEDIFFQEPFILRSDVKHTSKQEKRYYALGRTGRGRALFLAFTIRRKLIWVISVRDMTRKELETYERIEKENS